MALLWCGPQDTMLSGMQHVVFAFSTLWLWLLAMPKPLVGMRCGESSLGHPLHHYQPSAYSAGPLGQLPQDLPRNTEKEYSCPALPQKRTQDLALQCSPR